MSHSGIAEEAPEVAPAISASGIVTLEAAGMLAPSLGSKRKKNLAFVVKNYYIRYISFRYSTRSSTRRISSRSSGWSTNFRSK